MIFNKTGQKEGSALYSGWFLGRESSQKKTPKEFRFRNLSTLPQIEVEGGGGHLGSVFVVGSYGKMFRPPTKASKGHI